MRFLKRALLAAIVLTSPSPSFAQNAFSSLDSLPWRHIGPASFGGRIDDIEALPSHPSTIFVGTAGGGVFRSTNNGITWSPVFDKVAGSISIGDIAIAPSDENIVWVGTGEANSRQSTTWGDGVYKSLDGGSHWQFMGLKETQHVGRIVIHPRDPNIVFVAALGRLFGNNKERGLYRTKNGGASWEQVLKVDDQTGVVDVAIDPNGRTLYAATYQRQRRGFGFVGGGAGSGLWRSLDGGDNWERLTNGLPSGPMGRIGIAIAPSAPATVYAVVENRNGGVFRSDDQGFTWRRVNSLDPRPMYYSQLRVDPRHPDKLWLLGTNLHRSTDGGKTFSTEGTGEKIHVDHHALWIDPSDGDHMMLGNDGGLYFTYDGARNWDFVDNLPIGQYYDVDVDDRDPYYIYGGTQDNGTWAIPVRTFANVGITNADVLNIAYGDGFYSVTDPNDPEFVYANSQQGRAYRVHLATREEQGIRPVSADTGETYRWNWSTPMHRSARDPKTVYYGGNRLFRTRDAGTTWEVISPDLTKKQEWKKLPIMGVVRDSTTLSRDDGVGDFGTISTISESPFTAGAILVGTDDGNVQLTGDGGKTWSDITSRFKLPGARWVSRVLWSRHDARTAYVTFDGHYDDDPAPYIFRTTDGGATWVPIAGDLPAANDIKVVEEHPKNRDVMFVGTEFGLYATFNGGKQWSRIGGSMPRVRVDDIMFHPRTNDLIVATHGRSIIVLDDAVMFDKGNPNSAPNELTLYPVRMSMQRFMQRILPTPGAKRFAAPNPPDGALITYSVRRGIAATPDTAAHVVITNDAGKEVRRFNAPGSAGLHRVSWDLRYDRAPGVSDEDEGWFGPPRGGWVLPGRYTVRVEVGSDRDEQTVEVRGDPRRTVAKSDVDSRHAAFVRIASLEHSFNAATKLWSAMDTERKRIDSALAGRNTLRDSLAPLLTTVRQKIDSLGGRFRPGFGGPKFAYLDLEGSLQASSNAPTAAQQRSIEQLDRSLRNDIAALNALLAGAFADLRARAAGATGSLLAPVAMPPQ